MTRSALSVGILSLAIGSAFIPRGALAQLHADREAPEMTELYQGLGMVQADGTAEPTWISGDDIRSLASDMASKLGPRAMEILAPLKGVMLTPGKKDLLVEAQFEKAFEVQLQSSDETPLFQPYGVRVPKLVRFHVQMTDGAMHATGLDQANHSITILMQMPLMPDGVQLRDLKIDFNSGKVRVEAGVIGDLFGVVANAEIQGPKFDGVDVWQTILANLSAIDWSLLTFGTL